ncbi:MAG: ribonuclease H-like domain-containing protein [Candidatus Omnitrophota bacterium]
MADLYEKLKRFSSVNSAGKKTEEVLPAPLQPVSIPQQLLQIPGLVSGAQLIGAIEKREAEKKKVLLAAGVEETTNSVGSYGLRLMRFGGVSLPYPPQDIIGREIVRQTGEEFFQNIRSEDLLFLDTETTGLAGGTGTLPFLIGAGYFEDGDFCLRQYLMRDYDEEPAVLHELLDLFPRFRALASYNGKCFDAPLLHSRFLLNRLPSPLLELPHYDVLYPARRFWRDRLPNCSLSTIEAAILGRRRDEDVPSEQIPFIYFDFLRGLRVYRMKPVISHNAEDILSLAMLAAKTCRMTQSPLGECGHGLELAGYGRFLAFNGDGETACACLEESLRRGDLPGGAQLAVYRLLAKLYKRRERYLEAAAINRRALGEFDDFFACVDLAKFYEHHAKQCGEALHLTERALRKIAEDRELEDAIFQRKREWEEKLNHRRRRLLRKLQGN